MSAARRRRRTLRALAATVAIGIAIGGTGACGDREPEAPAPGEEPLPAPEVEPAPEPPAAEPPPAVPPAAVPPAAVPAPAPAPPPAAGPAPAPETPAASPISLQELGNRIKQTRAIGLMTKLALKNDIDDLVERLRRYHEKDDGQLDALREHYEALVLKLLALLEKPEPELALALVRSRDDIWSRLADPVRFAELTA